MKREVRLELPVVVRIRAKRVSLGELSGDGLPSAALAP